MFLFVFDVDGDAKPLKRGCGQALRVMLLCNINLPACAFMWILHVRTRRGTRNPPRIQLEPVQFPYFPSETPAVAVMEAAEAAVSHKGEVLDTNRMED